MRGCGAFSRKVYFDKKREHHVNMTESIIIIASTGVHRKVTMLLAGRGSILKKKEMHVPHMNGRHNINCPPRFRDFFRDFMQQMPPHTFGEWFMWEMNYVKGIRHEESRCLCSNIVRIIYTSPKIKFSEILQHSVFYL